MNITYPESAQREIELMRQRDEARRELRELREYATAAVYASLNENKTILQSAINNLNEAIKRTTY